MTVMAVAQVEDRANIDAQIKKQTTQPDRIFILVDKNPAAPAVSLAANINARRAKIAANHQLLRKAVMKTKPDLVWQLEGDGELPENCLDRLISSYRQLRAENSRLAYVSAVQVGRHGLCVIGAWHFNDGPNQKYSSADPVAKGIISVDATGMYCLLADARAWLEGQCAWDGQPYGPDVVFGLSLKAKKYDIYIDMGLAVGHITENKTLYPHNVSVCRAEFYKDESKNKWLYRTL